jgi:hypothetical protein
MEMDLMEGHRRFCCRKIHSIQNETKPDKSSPHYHPQGFETSQPMSSTSWKGGFRGLLLVI